MDYLESFRMRFSTIDRNYPKNLAIKKKRDIRRIVMTDGPEDKRSAMIVVWAEEQVAGRV